MHWRLYLNKVIESLEYWAGSVNRGLEMFQFPTMFEEDFRTFIQTVIDQYDKLHRVGGKYDADVLILYISYESKCLQYRFDAFMNARAGLTMRP
jgi:hypothetical protein